MEYTVYKLTNKLNGLGYVGMTKNFKRRMKEHHWSKCKALVDKAIHEYGWENFTAEVIEVCDAEIAEEREKYWIKELNTLEPHGYNCTTGGNKGTKFTLESSLRFSAKQIEKTVFPVLQAELDKQKITRYVFAQKLGFAPRAVSSWMTGRCEPRLSTAIKVKEVLGVDMPLEELFAKATGRNNPNKIFTAKDKSPSVCYNLRGRFFIMRDDDFKTYYEEQRELLREAFAEIGQKAELLLTVGQLLMENGADTAQIVRDMKRVAAYMGIDAEKFHLHIMYTTLFLHVGDEHHSHTSFRKCPKHGVNMRIISAVSRLTWRAMKEHYTIDEFKGELEAVAKRPRYPHWVSICAAGSGCGAFCTLFGCDFNAAIYTAVSAIIAKIVQMQCAERFGINPYVSMTFAAFTATIIAYLTHFLPTTTPWHPLIAAALFLVPGIPMINALSDMINTYLISGAARIIHTLIIVGAMTFGIVFAIGMADFDSFTNLAMLPDSNYGLFMAAAAIGAMSFAIFFNLPPRLLFAAACGGAICVCTRNFFIFELGMSSAVGTLAGATLVSVIAIEAVHWLHTPSLVLVVPAVIPLVPGVLIYRFLFAVINIRRLTVDELLSAIQSGVDALLIILAIAIGAAMPNIFASRSFAQRSKDKQEKLLNEIYETRD